VGDAWLDVLALASCALIAGVAAEPPASLRRLIRRLGSW
jgi:hypothetical protein